MEAAECRLMIQHHACWLPPPRSKKSTSRLRKIVKRVATLVPYFILTVTVVQLVVLLLVAANTAGGHYLYETLVFDLQRRCEVWRFVTYMLLHEGAAHAALNLGIQLLFAVPLEREQGRRRTALIYIGGGLAGSLSTSVFGSDSFLVGASGGVYALLTSQLANAILNFPGLRYRLQRFIVVVVLTLADVVFSLYHHYFLGNTSPRVGWAAHSGGALAGLLIGLLIFRAPPVEVHSFPNRPSPTGSLPAAHKPSRQVILTALRCSSAALLAGALAAAIALNLMQNLPS